MCLKRYSMTPQGKAIRLNTKIDIPVEIGLPHFIQDDQMNEEGPIFGNFKLSLQSVVCHRGKSVNSGHYIALVRGTNTKVDNSGGPHIGEDSKHWMRFDDLAAKRITLINIEEALKEETPYLLFYQIVPIEGDPGRITEGEQQPPVYAGSDSRDSGVGGLSRTSLSLTSTREDFPSSGRPSFEITAPENPRGRTAELENGRSSITFAQPMKAAEASSVPDQKPSRPASRPASQTRQDSSHTRTASQTSDMIARSLSRLSLTGKRSKEVLPVEVVSAVGEAQVPVREVPNTKREPVQAQVTTKKDGKREKSKIRLSKGPAASGKTKAEKPDRECSVM